MITVRLSQTDLSEARQVGRGRCEVHRKVGRHDAKVLPDGVDVSIQGCIGEKAVSKALSLPWDGKFFEDAQWQDWRLNGHDVSGLEVRATRHPKGCLLLKKKDRDDKPFVLALIDDLPNVKLVGWLYAHEGKKPRYWRDVGYGRPCYLVPQELLRPMETLTINRAALS